MSSFDRTEREQIAGALRQDTCTQCPSCGGPVAVIRTAGHTSVSYVRDRVVVRCANCRKSVAIETRELES